MRQDPLRPPAATPRRRHFLGAAAALAAALTSAWPGAARALGTSVELTVVDRDTNAALETFGHRGRTFVAGRPGARYALRVTNRTAERVLVVMAVDGVNIVTGQTADWAQGGYVLSPWQSYDITGWRKSDQEVAAFEFTALPDSYAARTGRPHDVGVIGVAVFNERVVRPAPPPVVQRPEAAPRADAAEGNGTALGSAAKSAAERQSADAGVAQDRSRLGTGHGARETSYASSTSFVRASARPAELIAIQYDRWDNLVRAGVIPQYGLAHPRPFPRSNPGPGYVPDPPMR